MQQQQEQGENKEEVQTPRERMFPVPQHFRRDDSEESTKLSIDVAGFATSDLEIRVQNHILTLHGSRKNSLGDVFVLHRKVGLDERVHNQDSIQARTDNGVLEITIPKMTPKPTTIAIPIHTVTDIPHQDIPRPEEEAEIQEAEVVLQAPA